MLAVKGNAELNLGTWVLGEFTGTERQQTCASAGRLYRLRGKAHATVARLLFPLRQRGGELPPVELRRAGFGCSLLLLLWLWRWLWVCD